MVQEWRRTLITTKESIFARWRTEDGCPHVGMARQNRCSLSRRACDLCRDCGDRELDGEDGATFGSVVASDLTGVVLDDAIHSAQAQSCALADWLGGIERIENALRVAESRAGVREQQHDFGALPLSRDVQRAAV